MKAIIVKPPNLGVYITQLSESKQFPDKKEVKIRILENGICGTDREIVNAKIYASPPPGDDYLILGHEAIGVIERVGEEVRDFVEGDLVMPINRRGCGKCLNCLIGRPDHCETGERVQAGREKLHGFMREYYFDNPRYLVSIPKGIKDIAILAQPLSDLEKSIEEILFIQKRQIWTCDDGSYTCRKALVIGTGTTGTLVSMLLKTYGFRVYITNKRELKPLEKEIFSGIGVKFYNSANGYEELFKEEGQFDMVFDTTGKAEVLKQVLPGLKYNAVIGLFGFANEGSAQLYSVDLQRIASRSIALVGLVNGQKPHFQQAVIHLAAWKSIWPDIVSKLITRVVNISEEEEVVKVLKEKEPGEIKIKIVW